MKAQTEPSRFRIDKAKADALISLTYGNPLRGCFFVAHASARLVGPEPVGELLNGETDFFPFELHDAAGIRAVLLNRRHVVTVALADNEAQRQPGVRGGARTGGLDPAVERRQGRRNRARPPPRRKGSPERLAAAAGRLSVP